MTKYGLPNSQQSHKQSTSQLFSKDSAYSYRCFFKCTLNPIQNIEEQEEEPFCKNNVPCQGTAVQKLGFPCSLRERSLSWEGA